jgi:hypothetical protein
MRINNTGYAKFGISGSYEGGNIYEFNGGEDTGACLVVRWTPSGITGGNAFIIKTPNSTSGTGYNLIGCETSNGAQFRVRGDGTIFAQNTTVQSISDIRVKENICDAEDGLNVVLGLRPVRFDFKEGFGNERKNQLGFIAQEVEQVFPDAVDESGQSGTDEEPYKSVGPSALIPVLVKAIQEQQSMITALQAEVAALKAS